MRFKYKVEDAQITLLFSDSDNMFQTWNVNHFSFSEPAWFAFCFYLLFPASAVFKFSHHVWWCLKNRWDQSRSEKVPGFILFYYCRWSNYEKLSPFPLNQNDFSLLLSFPLFPLVLTNQCNAKWDYNVKNIFTRFQL